jgi:hypothetical protein
MSVRLAEKFMSSHIFYFFGRAIVIVLEFYLVKSYLKYRYAKERALKILIEFTKHGPSICAWLKEHFQELQTNPIAMLNHPEFVHLIDEDQVMYERVLAEYSDYSDNVMPPKELRQHLIELAQGKYKQTH